VGRVETVPICMLHMDITQKQNSQIACFVKMGQLPLGAKLSYMKQIILSSVICKKMTAPSRITKIGGRYSSPLVHFFYRICRACIVVILCVYVYLFCICYTLCIFVVSYVYLLYLMCIGYLMCICCIYVYLLYS